MQVCVIGGSGFIGTRLCQRLQASKTSRFSIVDKVSSRSFPELTRLADVRREADLREAVPPGAVIVNLAAEHRDDVSPASLYEEVNVGGARNICQVARERDVRQIIFTSSVAVYGFARVGTDESGAVRPFNEYGRTKSEAEAIFREWQMEAPETRSLVVIRPTVVFGEGNRGNVYNLLNQIATNRFMMVGSGENRKSMAYVENVAAFIQHSMSLGAGLHVFNFVDKPDFSMNELVKTIRQALGKQVNARFRLPYSVGYGIGTMFDIVGAASGRKFPISRIRIRKFCADSVFDTHLDATGFVPPVDLSDGLARTVKYEFLERQANDQLFYTE